jgi:hypothetical protein
MRVQAALVNGCGRKPMRTRTGVLALAAGSMLVVGCESASHVRYPAAVFGGIIGAAAGAATHRGAPFGLARFGVAFGGVAGLIVGFVVGYAIDQFSSPHVPPSPPDVSDNWE